MSIAASDLVTLLVHSAQDFTDPDVERKLDKILLTTMDKIVQKPSDFLGRMKPGKEMATPVVRWLEEEAYPTGLTAQCDGTAGTLTFTGTVLGESLASVTTAGTNALKNVLRVGTILGRESDGIQFVATDVDTLSGESTYYITGEGWSGDTLTDDSAGVTWRIVGEKVSDYTASGNYRALDRKWRKCFTQLFEENFAISKTRLNTAYEEVSDEPEHQIAALLQKLRRQLGYAVFRSKPYKSGGTYYGLDGTDESMMCGLLWWAEQMYAENADATRYVNMSSTELDLTDVQTLCTNMFLNGHADFSRGDWGLIVHPLVNKQVNNWDEGYRRSTKDNMKAGHIVQQFMTSEGEWIKVIPDQYIRPDVAHVIKIDDCSYGYYKNDRMDRKKIETDNRVLAWLLSFQTYGVVMRKPTQSLGTLYGIATS